MKSNQVLKVVWGNMSVDGTGTETIWNSQGDNGGRIQFTDNNNNQVILLEIDNLGNGRITGNQFNLYSNPNNNIQEQFGPVMHLADNSGTHAFRIWNNSNTQVFNVTSSPFMTLIGSISAPGGQGSNSAAIYIGTSGSLNTLNVEFNSGASQTIATEP